MSVSDILASIGQAASSNTGQTSALMTQNKTPLIISSIITSVISLILAGVGGYFLYEKNKESFDDYPNDSVDYGNNGTTELKILIFLVLIGLFILYCLKKWYRA